MRKNNGVKKASVFLVLMLLFMASSAAIADTEQKPSVISTSKTAMLSSRPFDEVELRYYEEDGLSTVIGFTTSPATWKSGIRLTQEEMAPYMTWTMTSVNVAFSGDNGHPEIDVRIYIYDQGTQTTPGDLIVNDTTATLDTTGITTIPLVTPVDLEGHEELWVAVEWYQIYDPPCYYAWMDTVTGPHVPYKSDWIFLNNAWNQLHVLLPSADGRWGIGAIVEGTPQQPPEPPVISGPTNGFIGTSYSYTISTNDPEGDSVYYCIDWGDGTYNDWFGPFDSGEQINASHSWNNYGHFKIIVKAKDSYNQESNWSDPHQMTIYLDCTSAIVIGIFLQYQEDPEFNIIYIAPFFGIIIQQDHMQIYSPKVYPWVSILIDASTPQERIFPDLITIGSYSIGIIIGKFDIVVTPMH